MPDQARWGVIPKFGTLIPGFGSRDEAEQYINDYKMEGAIAIPLGVAEGYPPRQRELPGVERQPELSFGGTRTADFPINYGEFDDGIGSWGIRKV